MPNSTKIRTRLLGSATAFVLGGAFVMGGIIAPTTPVFADAVSVEAPAAPGFADVVSAVSPAVVSVRVRTTVEPAAFDGGMELPEDHPLRRFFDKRFGERGMDRNRNERDGPRRFGASQGSGFFVSADGYIVTNNHVIDNGSEFTVVMNDGQEIDAKLVGTDPKTDLAVLKVDGDDFTYVEFDKDIARVGEWVVAVGNPFGLGGTVTAGIVSGQNRDIGSGPYDDFLQIDAAVNKGNSGGPAFNLTGEVIGVNTAIFSPSGGNVGIAFAISAKSASKVVADLIENGEVTRGYLGVRIQPVTQEIADALDLDAATGAIIAEATDDAPAARAGLRAGDVIVEVDGETIEGPKELSRTIAAYSPDQTADVTIVRDGERRTIAVALGELPGQERRAEAPNGNEGNDNASVDFDDLGLSLTETDNGVSVASVMPDGAADERGLQAGDRIVSINGTDTTDVQSVAQALSKAMETERKAVLLEVRSGERSRFVALPVAQG